jgi:hypothetical protein
MLLTRRELYELTGYERPSAQIRWLRQYGIRFFEAADGYPRVLRTDLENKEKQRTTSPNLSAIKESA